MPRSRFDKTQTLSNEPVRPSHIGEPSTSLAVFFPPGFIIRLDVV